MALEGFGKFVRDFFCIDDEPYPKKPPNSIHSFNYTQPRGDFSTVDHDPWLEKHKITPALRSNRVEDAKTSTTELMYDSENGTDVATVGPVDENANLKKSKLQKSTITYSVRRSVPRRSLDEYNPKKSGEEYTTRRSLDDRNRRREYDYRQQENYPTPPYQETENSTLEVSGYNGIYNGVEMTEEKYSSEHRVLVAKKKLSQVFDSEFWVEGLDRPLSNGSSQPSSTSKSTESQINSTPSSGDIFNSSESSDENLYGGDSSDMSQSVSILTNAPTDEVIPTNSPHWRNLPPNLKNLRDSMYSASSSVRSGPTPIFRDSSTSNPSIYPDTAAFRSQ